MKRIYINTLEEHIEKEVTIFGWIDIRRDHGKLIFLDLRDVTGKVQMVVLPNHTEAIATASTLRNEWVVEVKGIVNKRPERMCKKGLNGNIEIEVTSINVLNESLTPPFDVTNNTKDIDEEVRLEYRYLDLRSERMKNNILTRSIFVQTAREYLFEQSFN
jgi:aspartyl-tRNA synthetase